MWIEIQFSVFLKLLYLVTPYAGVWIEIFLPPYKITRRVYVTPYAGVWIEISVSFVTFSVVTSLPTRECGLKLVMLLTCISATGHSLRGSVD